MASILITGASGKIGKNLITSLLRSGNTIRALVKDNMIKDENVEIFYGNVLDISTLEKAMKDVDTIYHLAAVTDNFSPKDDMYEVNVLGTKNVIDASKGKKVIYLSTTSVMGKNFKELPVSEKTKCSPTSFYAETKEEAENLVLENNGIVVRSPEALGSDFAEDFGFLISELEKGDFHILGDGKNFLQWIHVSDIIQALVLANSLGKPKNTYIVAGKDFKTQKQLLAMFCKHLGVEPPTKHTSSLFAKAKMHSSMIKGRLSKEKPLMLPCHVDMLTTNMTFDMTKAKTDLGFEPTVGLDEAIKEVVDSYVQLHKEEQKVPDEISEEQA
ncbi:MAG: GDP-mannose 4,6-dehydratase [Candidatus Aenigmarchaeota archaeon]|nr:GDP-mannose 4,6-dehydratase [Candidatus Aenigmarchaeota archaeon]